MKLITRPLNWVGRFFLWLAVLPAYKFYLTAKKIFTRFYAPQASRHRLVHPFSRRYLTHLTLIIITSFTLAANLNAGEARRQDFNQQSVIFQLIVTEDLGSIEEEGPVIQNNKVSRYLGETGAESKIQIAPGGAEDILPSTAAGGGAVVRPILSPTEENLRRRDEIVYYAVQPGDTISEVAEQFGVSVNTILWENNLSSYQVIRPGDKLAILQTTGIRHKVVRGDTLKSIAKKYSVDEEKIIETNRLASADDLPVRQHLLIPGGAKPYVAPVYTAPKSFYQPTTKVAGVTGSGTMLWPSTCRRITQYFTWRHSGVDIGCSNGSEIYAADGGTVVKGQGGWNGGYGLMITIDHGNGVQTLYGHLSKIYVRVGETVEKGQTIASEGSTGRSTGPHLHFEVRVGGVRKNSLNYVK